MEGAGTSALSFFLYVRDINMNEEFLHQIEQIITRLGYECVHVGIKNDFGKLRLQILIDTLGGINVDDCEQVSKRVNKFLDDSSDIPGLDKGRYYLEVSSPGVERPLYKLTDYERFSGREARIRLSDPIEGRKTFTGLLAGISEGCVNISCEGEVKRIPFGSIKGGNLVYRFENDKHDNRKGRKK